MVFTRFMARQLAHPSGLFGRWVMGGRLDRLNVAMNDLAMRQLAATPDSVTLEIGFGGGDLLTRLSRAGTRVAGADISEAMVARLRRRLAREIAAGRADIRLASADALPFADAAFGNVCTINTLYFWPDLPAVLTEVRRVLRPAGRFIICFNPEHELRKWPGHRYGFTLFTADAVRRHLENAGFRDVEIVTGHDPGQGEFACVTAARP